MASGTTRKRARVLNLVLFYQFAADLFLVARRLITHGGDEFARPDILLGMAVAVQAPLHLERVLLPGERHLIHPAVASLTTHSLVDVDAVIEIDIIRQIVHAPPWDGGIVAEARAHRFKRWAGEPDLRMAVHASLGGWNVGEARSLDRSVAIAAVKANAAHMVGMAERNGLFPGLCGTRIVIGPVQFGEYPGQKAKNEYRAEDGDSRKCIRAVMKDLRHGSTTSRFKRQNSVVLHQENNHSQANNGTTSRRFERHGFDHITAILGCLHRN
jgi:hypothetical protein